MAQQPALSLFYICPTVHRFCSLCPLCPLCSLCTVQCRVSTYLPTIVIVVVAPPRPFTLSHALPPCIPALRSSGWLPSPKSRKSRPPSATRDCFGASAQPSQARFTSALRVWREKHRRTRRCLPSKQSRSLPSTINNTLVLSLLARPPTPTHPCCLYPSPTTITTIARAARRTFGSVSRVHLTHCYCCHHHHHHHPSGRAGCVTTREHRPWLGSLLHLLACLPLDCMLLYCPAMAVYASAATRVMNLTDVCTQ